MIQITAYLRNEDDLARWKALENKADWLHRKLQEAEGEVAPYKAHPLSSHAEVEPKTKTNPDGLTVIDLGDDPPKNVERSCCDVKPDPVTQPKTCQHWQRVDDKFTNYRTGEVIEI